MFRVIPQKLLSALALKFTPLIFRTKDKLSTSFLPLSQLSSCSSTVLLSSCRAAPISMAPRLRLNPPKCQALEQLSTAAPALPPTTQPPLGFTPLPSFSSISQAGSATLHPPSSTTRSRRDAVLAPPTTAPAASAVLPTASNVSSAQAPSQTLPPPLFPVSSFPTVTSGAKFSAPPAPFAPAGPPPPVSQPTFSAPPPLFPLPSFPATESGSTVPAPAVTFPPASSLLWGPHPSISASATTSTPANYSTPVPFRAIPPLPTRFSPSDFPPPTPTQATAAWYNGLSSLLNLEKTNSSVWFTLVGLYFQDSGRTPAEVWVNLNSLFALPRAFIIHFVFDCFMKHDEL